MSTLISLSKLEPGHGMEWKMEWKFWHGIWKMPQSNGIKDFKNEMEDNLPYFHTKFRAWHLQKNIYEGHSKSNALKSNARTGFDQSCLYLAQT